MIDRQWVIDTNKPAHDQDEKARRLGNERLKQELRRRGRVIHNENSPSTKEKKHARI